MEIYFYSIPCTSNSNLTIVMLPGWGRTHLDLKPLGELLSQKANICILDLPGFGLTPPPPEAGWDTLQYAEKVVEFIRSRNLTNVLLLGHSFGGRVSLRIAANNPELICGMILINSHGIKPIRSTYQNIRVWCIKKIAKLVKFCDHVFNTSLYINKFAKRFGSADYRNAGILKNTFVKTISEDQSQSIASIEAKALLLWGSLDQETPLILGQKLHSLLKNSRLVVLEGKDHNAHQGLGAHLCANYIFDFMDSLSS